jgi:catechol 2,3-dioxygenase-like lactoylglutathione lyase family enzyme
VSDRAVAARFYETVLQPLGLTTSYTARSVSMWDDFALSEVDEGEDITQGLHVAFASPSREQVDAFWHAGVDAGHEDNGPPGPRPQYREDYYGAFLRDPDGNNIEAVHHGALRRAPDGIIDHVWIRVADLPAAAAFYRLVAAAAGFDVIRDDEDRVSFGGRRGGGSFSLVQGVPTENLHMAFPGDDAAVLRFYEEATAAGYRGNGEPGERPQYHLGYFAAYVLDPDGNNIEVVNHNRP